MRKILITIALLMGVVSYAFGQCQLTSGSGVYEATCFKEINQSDQGMWSIEIAFVNQGNGRVVMKGAGIDRIILPSGGIAYLFLEDKSVIKLIDRDNVWQVNGSDYRMYNLTKSELQKLKKQNIKKIRIAIAYNEFNDFANNGYDESNPIADRYDDPIDFPTLILEVFN